MEMDADDAMEDAEFEEPAAVGAEGEEVQLGEAGRNWERPPAPALNPRTDALGAAAVGSLEEQQLPPLPSS